MIPYRNIDLRIERTHPLIDQKSFVLKSIIDAQRGAIPVENFSTYIDILTDHCSYTLTDISLPFEQVLLIQCDEIFGMNNSL